MLLLDGLHAISDVPLRGEEAQDIAVALAHELGASADHAVDHVGVDLFDAAPGLHLLHQGAVADLHRVRASGDLDDGGGVALGVGEVGGEALRVDGGGGDNHLQVRALRQEALEVAEEEVDVERALVGLVDDDRVVGVEEAVALHLGEQDAVRHQLRRRAAADLVVEADGVADALADVLAQLVCDALCHGTRRQPARLGVPDHAAPAAAQLQQHLRNLGCLARARLAGDDHHLVVAHQLHDVAAARGDRKLLGVGDLRHRGVASRDYGRRRLHVPLDRGQCLLAGRLG